MSARANETIAMRPRSGKGERTYKAILEAVGKIVHGEGLVAASQDNIAKQAGISQSTLRHYFPTKDGLIHAYFAHHYQTYRQNIEAILLKPMSDPKARIREIARSHLDHIRSASDIAVFESWALMARNSMYKKMRDDWYKFLAEHYVALIQQINPDTSPDECRSKATRILTISFGAWITLGRSKPDALVDETTEKLQSELLSLIDAVVDC